MFHDSKKEAALIVAGMPGEDGEGEDMTGGPDTGDHNEDLHALAEEFLAAVHSKDPAAVAEAFRAMFLAMEQEPHEEAGEEEEMGDGPMG